MDISSLIARIEKTAPLRGAAAWDKSGVQIAGRCAQVAKCAVMLDPLPELVFAALEWGASFVLCHHPLSLEPRFLDRLDDYHRVVSLVLGREAWLYAAHTSLDAQPEGPAGWLASALKLREAAILEQTTETGSLGVHFHVGENAAAGFGLVGDLPEALPWLEFKEQLSGILGRSFWLQSGPTPETVRRVAYCPGSGASLMDKAFNARADVYVTGDMKYHQALTAKGLVIDVGHFLLEEEMMRRFAAELGRELRAADAEVKFFPGKDPQQLVLAG